MGPSILHSTRIGIELRLNFPIEEMSFDLFSDQFAYGHKETLLVFASLQYTLRLERFETLELFNVALNSVGFRIPPQKKMK